MEGVFAYRNASSESVATVRKLVETFVAQRRLRQEQLSDAPEAGGRPATRPEFIQVWQGSCFTQAEPARRVRKLGQIVLSCVFYCKGGKTTPNVV